MKNSRPTQYVISQVSYIGKDQSPHPHVWDTVEKNKNKQKKQDLEYFAIVFYFYCMLIPSESPRAR